MAASLEVCPTPAHVGKLRGARRGGWASLAFSVASLVNPGMPPLAIRCSPVIHRASFDARKTAIDAMFNVRAYFALHAMS